MSELLDLVAVSQRAATWRFDLVDSNRQVIERNLAVSKSQVPTISVDVSRAMKRTLSGIQLTPGVLDDINIIKDRLAVTMVLHDGTEWPQGVFMFSDVSKVILSSFMVDGQLERLEVPSLNMVDQCLIVDQQLDHAVAFGPGTVITTAITSLLMELPIEFEVDPAGAVISATQEAVAWPAGTSRLKAINDLAAMVGYHELFFDNTGKGQLHLMPNPNTAPDSAVVHYPVGGRTYIGRTTLSTNLLDLPNRFVVVNTGAGTTSVSGTYDIPASAPHSAANFGFYKAHVEGIQGVNTNTDARLAAQSMARSWQYAYETLEFAGPPDPRHDHYDVLDYEGDRYLELAWSMQCQDGSPMSHSARRTYEAVEGEVFAP